MPDPDLDYPVPFRCGCTVTFLGMDHHQSRLLTPCRRHADPSAHRARARFLRLAEDELRLRRLVGPEVPAGDLGPAPPRRRT